MVLRNSSSSHNDASGGDGLWDEAIETGQTQGQSRYLLTCRANISSEIARDPDTDSTLKLQYRITIPVLIYLGIVSYS